MKTLMSLLAAFVLASTAFVAEAAPRHKPGAKAVKVHKQKVKKAHKKTLHAKKHRRAPVRAYTGPRVAAQ